MRKWVARLLMTLGIACRCKSSGPQKARLAMTDVVGSTEGEDRTLALAGDAQRLRLELDERDRQVDALRRQLEKQQRGESARVADAVQAQIEPFLVQAAAPAVQIMTQAHLAEVHGQPVQAKDVLTVAKRLVRALQEGGLAFDGSIGDRVPYDPGLHEPLSTETPIRAGEPVEVKFLAASYRGRLIQKVGVVPAGRAGRS